MKTLFRFTNKFLCATLTAGLAVIIGCGTGFKVLGSGGNSSSSSSLPEGVASDAVSTKTRMGDRFYIASVLQEIYTTGSAASDAAVITAIKNSVLADAHFFGGIAHTYDPPEMQTLTTIDYNETTTYANIGAPASAVLISVCTALNEQAGVVSLVETKAGLTGNNSPTAGDFAALYKLFYPMNGSNANALSGLSLLFDQVKTASNRSDALKTVIYTLCTSPDWTLL